jgi:glycosyltransferase involved in cell wall biosynthesis
MKVSIIIPAYNEENRIRNTLLEYHKFFSELKKEKTLDFEMVVVLNGCKDGTLDIVKEFSKKHKEIKYLNFNQSGKGFAIVEGFKYSLKGKSQLIGFADADMATPPEAFYDLIKNIKGCDGVIANRWDKRSKIKTRQTIFRRFLSRGFNLVVRTLFILPHRDTQCGAKIFKKDLLEKIIQNLGSSEWSFDVDLFFYARRAHAKIKSVPTVWNDKKGSKINLKKTPLKMLLSVIRLRLIHSPFKFVVRFYRKLPEGVKIH